MQDRPARGARYQGPLVLIQDGTLTIRRYYFPTGARPVVTPDDPGPFRAAMAAGIHVSSRAPDGARRP
jgi:hypothetical protein